MPWSPGWSGLSLREVFWLRSQTLVGFHLTNRLLMDNKYKQQKIIGCSPHLLPWSFTLLALPCAHQRAQHPSPTNLDFLHWSCCCLSIPILFWSCLGLLLCKSSRLFLKIFSSYLSSPAPPCTWSAPLNPSTSHQKSSPTLESIVKNQFWDFSEIFRDS